LAVGAAEQPVAIKDPPVGPPQISGYVREVFQDRDGNLWFGTNGDGVCRFDGTILTYFTVDEGFGGYAVRGIVQDAGGAMWFATDNGVSRYDSGEFTNYTAADGLSETSIWSMMLDRSGVLWVGTHAGVCRFDGESFMPFPLPRVDVDEPESRFSPLVVFAMLEDANGHLWFGMDGEGAHRFDGASFTTYTTADGLGGNMVRSLRADRHGRVWIGSDGGGVSRLDGDTFTTFTTADGLGSDRVYEILEDSAGHMWFATLGAGATRYDGDSFRKYGVEQGLIVNELPCPCGSGSKYKNCHGPGGGHVQEFFEDRDGNLWLGCSGGLFRLEGENLVNVTREGPWPARRSGPEGAGDE
jgi:ligand-binding sensor domain-containing protein